MVEKKDIPQWKGKPQGAGPFEHTACGANVKPTQIAATKASVNCQSCRRTRLWKYA
jgi:hypothetical protein